MKENEKCVEGNFFMEVSDLEKGHFYYTYLKPIPMIYIYYIVQRFLVSEINGLCCGQKKN